jgi:Mn-dependent DtxR family transcriptional regulator
LFRIRYPKHAKAQKKKRDLERDVLTHLKKCGPVSYDALAIRFDLAGDSQPILRGLREYGYIDVNKNKIVTLTTFGLQDLQGKV